MKKYLVLYHAPAEAMAMMASATPEQIMEGMKPWKAWQEKLGENLLDMGSPLMPGTRITPDGGEESSAKEVTGFSIIQAVDLASAKSMLEGHPHLSWHAKADIEIHEFAPMG